MPFSYKATDREKNKELFQLFENELEAREYADSNKKDYPLFSIRNDDTDEEIQSNGIIIDEVNDDGSDIDDLFDPD